MASTEFDLILWNDINLEFDPFQIIYYYYIESYDFGNPIQIIISYLFKVW